MYKKYIKRALSFIIALIALICIGWFIVLIAIWLHFANKGAGAFFTQERPGKDGKLYKVSPFRLLINDGNYYLLAFDDKAQDMRTYRIDRMKDVKLLPDPQEGKEAFEAIDLQSYTQRVFSMFGGEKQLVAMQFENHLLDSVIDRFGTKNASYSKVDDEHFSVSVEVELSNQFYSWLLQFGEKARIMHPHYVVQEMKKFLDRMCTFYDYYIS